MAPLLAALASLGDPPLPHIVHVVADDLGYDNLGFTNGNKTHTPHLNNLAAKGIVLTAFHAYKVCSPTRASIMTGRYPWSLGYYDVRSTIRAAATAADGRCRCWDPRRCRWSTTCCRCC